MAENIEQTAGATHEVGSDTVSISVPIYLAEAVKQFVRQLETEDEDTKANMFSLLAVETSVTHDIASTAAVDDWDTVNS